MGPRASAERGAALIEILVAMALLGIATAALLGGMVTMMRASTLHRDQAAAHALLESAAERVRAAAFVECASPASYQAAAQGTALPAGWTIEPTQVLDWDGAGYDDEACSTGASDPFGMQDLQLVTIRVTSPDGRTAEEVSVPKVLE